MKFKAFDRIDITVKYQGTKDEIRHELVHMVNFSCGNITNEDQKKDLFVRLALAMEGLNEDAKISQVAAEVDPADQIKKAAILKIQTTKEMELFNKGMPIEEIERLRDKKKK